MTDAVDSSAKALDEAQREAAEGVLKAHDGLDAIVDQVEHYEWAIEVHRDSTTAMGEFNYDMEQAYRGMLILQKSGRSIGSDG